MEIIVGKYCGFCAGVNYCVNKAESIINESKENIYCLGEIIHNETVINDLETKGMITVNTIEEVPDNSKVIFRAHGEAKEVYEKALAKNLEIIDLTCGKVKIIHNKVEKNNDKYIIIVGKKTHPEVLGTKGYAKNAYVIENEEDIADSFSNFKKTKLTKVYIVVQTTYNESKFNYLLEKIKEKYQNIDIIVDNTICAATKNRQDEVVEITKKADKIIIIGGKHSSNTKELANIAETYCQNVYLVQTLSDLKEYNFSKEDVVGVTAGASTPEYSINEIVKYLGELK